MSSSYYLPLWDETQSTVSGSTAYGYFDADVQFCTDAQKFAKLSGRKLGYPVVDIQLVSSQFYTAYETAVMQYSSIINQFNIKQNLLSIQGSAIDNSSGSVNLTHKPINQSFSRVLKLSQAYADQVNIGSNIELRHGYFTVTSSKQVYDLKEYRDEYHPNKHLQIVRVFHYPLPASHKIFDPYTGNDIYRLVQGFGFGNMAMSTQYTMMPLFADLLRMQSIQISDDIRRSYYGFSIQGGDKIRIFPIPDKSFKVHFSYILKQDRDAFMPQYYDDNLDYVTDPSNAPFQYMQYRKINSVGKSWIINFAHAIVKGMLGNIRGKYNSIPLPDGQISMDGDSLKSQSSDQQDRLITQLNEYLQTASRKTLAQNKRQQAQDLKSQLSAIPMYIYTG